MGEIGRLMMLAGVRATQYGCCGNTELPNSTLRVQLLPLFCFLSQAFRCFDGRRRRAGHYSHCMNTMRGTLPFFFFFFSSRLRLIQPPSSQSVSQSGGYLFAPLNPVTSHLSWANSKLQFNLLCVLFFSFPSAYASMLQPEWNPIQCCPSVHRDAPTVHAKLVTPSRSLPPIYRARPAHDALPCHANADDRSRSCSPAFLQSGAGRGGADASGLRRLLLAPGLCLHTYLIHVSKRVSKS
ncbi:hypothetical protein BKA81DRAFT_32995 [Phyllosticta paracitricarpa]